MNTSPPVLPLTLSDGSPLPPKPVVPGRLRTNEDWLTRQPELYQEVRDRIMGGDTNITKLAEMYASQRWNTRENKLGITEDAMRRAIRAMVVEDITTEKFREIVGSSSLFLTGEMVDKASEVGATARNAKDLGAVSMAMNMAVEVGMKLGGAPAPVIRHEHLHVHTTPDALEQRRQQLRAKLTNQSSAVVDAVPVVKMNDKTVATEGAATISDEAKKLSTPD